MASAEAVEPGDLLTLVYTSGTTGPPKGVQYLHSGLMYAVWAFADRLQPVSRGRNVSYLPMAHIAERQIGYYSAFCCGMTITTLIDARQRPGRAARGPADVVLRRAADLREDRGGDARARPATTRRGAALDAAVERVRDGEPWVDDPLLAPLREATGLEHAGWAGISGAPCSREMAERFHAVGHRRSARRGGCRRP